MTTITASTLVNTGYVVEADDTGTLVFKTGATPTTAVTISDAQVVSLANALPVTSGGTGATTASGIRTAAGATTVGGNMFTLTNPSAITFPRFNADNTVSALDAASFRTAIGASSGTVTSVSGTGTVSGLTLSGTVTSTGNLTLGGTLSLTSGNVTTALGYTPGTVTSVATGSGLTGGTITSSGTLSVAAGVPLQVQSTNYGTFSTTTSASYSDSGLSVSITPSSASNKVLVRAVLSTDNNGSNAYALYQLMRNATALAVSSNGTSGNGTIWSWSSATTAGGFCIVMEYLDSPATTSATTYKVQFAAANTGRTSLNRTGNNTTYGGTSTITVMEIKG